MQPFVTKSQKSFFSSSIDENHLRSLADEGVVDSRLVCKASLGIARAALSTSAKASLLLARMHGLEAVSRAKYKSDRPIEAHGSDSLEVPSAKKACFA